MSFAPLLELTKEAAAKGYAVPSFCAWNAETMKTILDEAQKMKAPVILMNGPGEFPLLSPGEMAAVAYSLIDRYTVPAALHLDHGDSLDMVRDCIGARYTSVMLDYSARPFEENVAALKKVVGMDHPANVTVEGELGMIGRDEATTTEGSKKSTFTDPEQAREYVERTGVDLLAVAIGNVHGFYRGEPHLEFDLLERIRSKVPAPLVLHGGTGLSEGDIRRGVSLGIVKVNVASELIYGIRSSLLSQWQAGRNPWVPQAFAEAVNAVRASIEKWIRITGAAGKA
ncbi:MAG TPA: class II fructose-bisphosphate aldolase [Spirochaetia bacterium]|nr:class II fructose-bisphosphate aldolase [Spirochaetia bacterium]